MLRAQAGANIQFLGWRPREELRTYYQQSRALIFPGEEDFGIVPLEAMAAGCPVIAYRKGGALETVRENETGLFFDEATVDSLASAVERFEMKRFDRRGIQNRAQEFSRSRCEAAFRQTFVEYQSEMS